MLVREKFSDVKHVNESGKILLFGSLSLKGIASKIKN